MAEGKLEVAIFFCGGFVAVEAASTAALGAPLN